MLSTTSWGCLRELLDARAIEWSSSIIQAKLIAIGSPQGTGTATSQPAWTYQVFTFQVSDVFDGPDETGQVQVVRFIGPEETRSDPCGQELTHQSLGKAFVLMLRLESQTGWSKSHNDRDPRTSQVHALKAFVFVHMESSDDLGSDGIADLRRQIADTRAAESQFSADDAKTQAGALANAMDDTEADEAEQALEGMGYRVQGAVEDVMSGVGETGKERLQRVLNAISVPAIVREQ